MRKNYLLAGLLLLGAYPVLSQNTKTVSGYIKTADSSRPLPSATVRLLHSRTLTTTDAAGYFTLMVRDLPDTLAVHYTGYKPRYIPVTAIDTRPLVILVEQDAGELAGVIVNTGYQSVPKERATGSFVQVDKELLKLEREISFSIQEKQMKQNGLANEPVPEKEAPVIKMEEQKDDKSLLPKLNAGRGKGMRI